MADWGSLPDMILAQIFGYLPIVDRICVGHVCTTWLNALYRPEAWHSFCFAEEDLAVGPCDIIDLLPNCGDNEDILTDIDRKIPCIVMVAFIQDVGHYFRNVKVFFRSQASHQIINSIAENCKGITELKIERMKSNVQVVRNHDSSCNTALNAILQQNTRLRQLDVSYIDSLSVCKQEKNLLPFGAPHSNTLTKLSLVQSFQSCNLCGLMYLVRLKELAIEPHLLSYSLIHHLAGKSLENLHVVAVSKHAQVYNENLQNWHWKEIKKQGPKLRVHCHFGTSYEWVQKDIILKEEMPVESMKYVRYKLLDYAELYKHVCKYSDYLVEFIDFSMSPTSYERFRNQSKSAVINSCLLVLVNECPNLRRFAAKEIIYSCVILAIFLRNKHICFFLNSNQVVYEPVLPDLDAVGYSFEEIEFIKSCCSTRHLFENTVYQLTDRLWRFYSYGELIEIMLSDFLKFI